MSKWDKLLDRILNMSNDLRYDELKKILESYGYVEKGSKGGSHRTFRKPGCEPITIPEHGHIKKAYVKMVRDVVEGKVER